MENKRRMILFRGKRVDNGEWVEGYLRFIYIDGKNQNGFIYTDKASIYNQDKCMNYDVLTETVGQYTGLEDKNGKKIFEGDVVFVLFTRPNGECNSSKCKFDDITNWELMRFLDLSDQIEVIGSIHDNSELLK